MGKSVRNFTISLIAAVISLFTLNGPVFATAQETTPVTSISASVSTQTVLTTFATPTTQPEEEKDDNDTSTEDSSTCYDQVGGIGWLICPGTSFLANVIDGAYDVLENLIKVNPVSLEDDAPIHVVWRYLRNITNVIFIIFFLVIIYSQLTGFGINNYGIKRTLPRIIIAAILVNLSFVICILAVDVSNIVGMSLRGVFEKVEADAIANSTISQAAADTSVAGIVATILGVGTIGTVGALAVSGGWAGLLWLLIPVILSGAIAIISAVVTMAARQALILLLIMISPLAFVAYLLPNTEKWFQKWYQLFMRMIIFYPMFSFLYGASQLAGLVMITSATNWLGVVLGIAVQVLPLFMSIPLMRMSGTILGRVDGFIRRTGAPLQGMTHRYADERRMLAKQRQLASNSYLPSTRLAQYLEQRKLNRRLDTEEALAAGHKQRMANYNRSMYTGRGQLSRRGLNRYYNMQRNLEADNVITQTNIDFDEGFASDGTDARVRTRDLHRIETINTNLIRNVDDAMINRVRQRTVDLDNTRSRAERIREGARDEHSQIHRQITTAFNIPNSSNDPAQQRAIQKSINATLSDAITDSHKVDAIAKSNYMELYDDMPAGPGIMHQLEDAIRTGDYNSASAATLIMAKRGDHGDIIRTMVDHSAEFADDFAMQKAMADTGLSLKHDNIYMWAWSKANMIRRGMSATNDGVTPYIDMRSFLSGQDLPTDRDHDALRKANLTQIFTDLTSWAPLASQDRTVYKEMLKLIQDGTIPLSHDREGNTTFPLLFPEKYIRSAAVSGQMDGEQLGTLNALLTGGFKRGADRQSDFFMSHQDIIHNQIMSYVNNMVANQLVTSKSSTIMDMNAALLAIHPDEYVERTVDGQTMRVSRELFEAFDKERVALNKPSAINQRNSMNKSIREMLDISLD
ncbi:MAG: hypothetical protein Q4D22_00885 [Candidatus Saccharibacteria bacterium]|nr:hypothetical protein [Candidatus Saccharibacteria bacterium]